MPFFSASEYTSQARSIVCGYTGSTGYTGDTGSTGYTGATGSTGYTGASGSTGYTGTTGYTGYTGSSGFPAGVISQYAGTAVPTGWLLCDGTAYPTASYPALYTAIGNTYGGDSTNFNVPNLMQKFPVGAQAVVSNGYNYALGQSGGEQVHTLTVNEMPSHNHTITTTGSLIGTTSALSSGFEEVFVAPRSTVVVPATDLTGGGQAHNNVPLYLALNFIIKY